MKVNQIINQKVEGQKQQNNTEKRQNYCIAFIGQNRTGKTSVAKSLAREWMNANPGKRVMVFDPQTKFADIATDFIFLNEIRTWGQKISNLRNALLILDDYRLIHPKAIINQEFSELLAFRSQWNVDIIYICHSPSMVLNTLTYYTTHYFIFYTLAQKDSFERKIPNYELCERAKNYINKYVRFTGRGTYPNFPHMIVDCEKERLYANNMNPSLFNEIVNSYKFLNE